MSQCLFCGSEGPFTRPEHIIPEALGNDDLVLIDHVCDKCNQYFGKEVENFVLGKTPLAFWRTFLGIRKKRGKLPHIDLSQPKEQKGRLPSVLALHDNRIGFTCHNNYSVSVDIDDEDVVREILSGSRERFTFVFTPLVLSMMGRFFCKIGLELICLHDPTRARSDEFNAARKFSRLGEFDGLWPIFHSSNDDEILKKLSFDNHGPLEKIFCYQYGIYEVEKKYTILAFSVGNDTWVVGLNDPYPTPIIQSAFPNKKLNLVWYTPDEKKRECKFT